MPAFVVVQRRDIFVVLSVTGTKFEYPLTGLGNVIIELFCNNICITEVRNALKQGVKGYFRFIVRNNINQVIQRLLCPRIFVTQIPAMLIIRFAHFKSC